jgi:hypothetical protein
LPYNYSNKYGVAATQQAHRQSHRHEKYLAQSTSLQSIHQALPTPHHHAIITSNPSPNHPTNPITFKEMQKEKKRHPTTRPACRPKQQEESKTYKPKKGLLQNNIARERRPPHKPPTRSYKEENKSVVITMSVENALPSADAKKDCPGAYSESTS